jgi:hypothetical protein
MLFSATPSAVANRCFVYSVNRRGPLELGIRRVLFSFDVRSLGSATSRAGTRKCCRRLEPIAP